MFTILDYSSALEYSIIRRYTNNIYYYKYDILSLKRINVSCHKETIISESESVEVNDDVDSDSDSIFRRTLLGYYAEGIHANLKENLI